MDLDHKIKLFNTLSKQKEDFVPIKSRGVSIYLCGPTVYDRATIGNFRTYIFGDILTRILKYNDFDVTYVQNITDVGHLVDEDNDQGEDKMEKGARKIGKTAREVADHFTELYWQDGARLNIQKPTISCKATEHIQEQIEMIQELEQKGFTYKTSNGIYFDTSRQEDYGKIAGLVKSGLQEGARVEINPEKRNITDFALWKFSPNPPAGGGRRHMEWDSPWGIGFPGWHIECSAMSIKYLGQPFDIHAGGMDLLPVHHTNEIAQNEAVYGHKTVNYWLHGGFILINGQKMSKSLGNAYTVQDIVDKGFDPLAYRYFTYTAHYKQELNFTWEALEAAETAYKRLVKTVAELSNSENQNPADVDNNYNDKFLGAINDDLNMPKALAVVWEMLKDKDLSDELKLNTLLKFDEVLGLSIKDGVEKLKNESTDIPTEIWKLVDERNIARNNKDWSRADEIRKKIEEMRYEVEDKEGKTKIIKRN